MKILTHIDCPKGFISKNDYDSHRPMIWLALKNTVGLVLEVGCGYGSTELFDAYCLIHDREFCSYENDKEWSGKFNLNKGVKVIFEKGYPDTLLPLGREDLVFIDSKPGEQRKILIESFANKANVIVCHDTEEGANYVYGMSEILSIFKYRIDYRPEGKPHTTAVSNVIDIEKWVHQD